MACTKPPEGDTAGTAPQTDEGLKRVTGIGGIFFNSDDPDAMREWYSRHLGIVSDDFGGSAFLWSEKDRPTEVGYTVWSPFADTTDYFAPSEVPFMVNFRVANLERLVAALQAEGVQVVGGIEQYPNGKFAWILDPEGRKIELWEPVPSAEDPYIP